MLHELHVRDIALIEEAWLEFGPGMTVLTGETGAGKTALLGALKLLIGERADTSMVRAGAHEALVEGRFDDPDTNEILAVRRVSADGRSRCSMDSELATVGALSARIGPLVDLHGQHEHQSLLSPPTHVGFLDRWVGAECDAALVEYRDALSSYRGAISEYEQVDSGIAEAARNSDYLRFVAAEIDKVDPRVGEDDELEARLPALRHAERLSEAAGGAASMLRGEGGALDRVGEAFAVLRKVEGIDPAVDELAERLFELQALVDDIGTSARAYRDAVEHDPAVLDAALSRLSMLASLKKKYGPTLADVLAERDRARTALKAADDSEAVRAEAAARVAEARSRLEDAARRLCDIRRDAAPGFSAALVDASADLAMPGARFEVAFSDLDMDSWTVAGPHRVEFLYSPAPGQPARPLAKIASGGEVSRVMLALKGVLGAADNVHTLVFDEIDAGIGGAAALSVGRRLAELARTHQVIVVTHLAQVAAFADDHLVVTKSVSNESATTAVARVAGDERVREIARMLSGNDSDASLAHARELLEQARA